MKKRLLITGGTGSFGAAVLEGFLGKKFEEVIIFSRDEKKQFDMRNQFSDPRIQFRIGDVRDRRSVDAAMMGVDYVFHAAALKQVPSCEFFPIEAVKTNILGAENVMDSAIAHGVEKVVILSTDKACRPVNAMGMTKALMEKVMVAKSREAGKTILCGTRYGNVMGSRGSVIPLFLNQIITGGPITVTDPGMTRFMMTLEQAVELVDYAFDHGLPGEIFVLKAPGARIGDLATAIQRITGTSIPVKEIGIRHGEKRYETLVTEEEMDRAEDLGEYFRVVPDSRGLNYDLYFAKGRPSVREEYHSGNNVLTVDEVAELLERTGVVKKQIHGE